MLVDPQTNLVWDGSMSTNMLFGHRDMEWTPRFEQTRNTHRLMSVVEAGKKWDDYAFHRELYRPDLPEIELHRFEMKLHRAAVTPRKMNPVAVMIRRMQAKHGHVITTALTKLNPSTPPIYSIKRKGKTQALALSLPDSIIHHSMYAFMFNDTDVMLAKIALAGNIAYEYDLTPFHWTPTC